IVYARQKGGAEYWQRIDTVLDEADKISHTDKAEVAILRAESLFAQEKLEESRKALEKARDAHPERVELWTALAALAERVRNPERARRVREAAARQFRGHGAAVAEVIRAGARHWADQRGEKGRAELKRLEEGLGSYELAERNILVNGLADAHYRAGNFADA